MQSKNTSETWDPSLKFQRLHNLIIGPQLPQIQTLQRRPWKKFRDLTPKHRPTVTSDSNIEKFQRTLAYTSKYLRLKTYNICP